MNKNFGWALEDATLNEVIQLMLKNYWNEVLVLDKEKRFIGLATKEHILRTLAKGTPRNMAIKNIYCQDIVTTSPEVLLADAREIMRQHCISCLPVIDANEKIVGILTAKDVCNGFSTKLEEVGKHLQTIMENINEAIQVTDCLGIVKYWNRSAEKLFGIKAKDIVGKNINTFYHDEIFSRVLKTFEPQYNVLCKLREGHLVVRNAVPVVTTGGDKIGVVCTTLDISSSHNLLEKLNQAMLRVNDLELKMARDKKKQGFVNGLFYTINPATRRILEQALRISETDATVLILGESGTGKDLLANIIHLNSKRAQRQFVEINCSAIPEALFESEMFGYEPGTFTGANRTGKTGKFELANGGTLFLDEIGELPLAMQAKLLRVIEERKFFRVGGTTPVKVDVRLIAATNRDLAELVAKKTFRKDLYYRLNVITLKIPPLRSRKEDIPGLVNRFVEELNATYGRAIRGVDDKVIKLFQAYNWPGNVRQLHNILERVVVLSEGQYITTKLLEDAGVMEILLDEQADQERIDDEPILLGKQNFNEYINKNEREAILKVLHYCDNNKARAARLLGIPRSTLYYKLRSLGISS